jgi:hypothetical protein
MSGKVQRRTVYALTVVALFALAGSWAFAATFVNQHPPPQNSGVTVVTPNGATETVQSSQMIALSPPLEAALAAAPAGQQAGSGHGLNSTPVNVLIASCGVNNCSANYSAVDPTNALASEDMALQVGILVPQGTSAAGFDAQVEITYATDGGSATSYAFGSGYFDTGTSTHTGGSTITVFLYVDLGTPATNPPSIANVVVTLNSCTSATVCP